MKQTFIAFDFETTGFHPLVAEIVEIGAVKFDGQGNVLVFICQQSHPRFARGSLPTGEFIRGYPSHPWWSLLSLPARVAAG